MQYEVKRRPGNQSPGPVTGFPSQQKAQPRPAGFGSSTTSRTASRPQVPRPATAYKKPGSKPVARRQPSAASIQRSSFGNASAAKRAATNRASQPSFKGTNAGRATGNYPAGGAAKNRILNSSYAPAKVANSFTKGQQAIPPAYNNHSLVQAVGSVSSPVGYQPSYVFNPAPDIPPKMPSGNGGNSIPNPRTVPDNFPDKQPCTCGQTGNGCTILDKFATGSKDLTEEHWKQLETLADTIIKTQVQFVTITGHTDTVGTDEKNKVLGIKRANEVARELKNTIHQQEPWAETAVFFKTKTRGEEDPVSATDDGADRRVVVCLKAKDLLY